MCQAFPRQEYKSDKNMIVVRDGLYEPLEVATASYFCFWTIVCYSKDKFITFSRNPQLIDLSSCDTFADKVFKISRYTGCK